MRQQGICTSYIAALTTCTVLAVVSAVHGQCDPSSTRVLISQESSVGVGDFCDNILGFLAPYATTGSAAEFYFGSPPANTWNNECLNPNDKRSHLLLADTSDGLTLFIVHDKPGVPDVGVEGSAEMRFELTNDADGAVRTAEDDPVGSKWPDTYTSNPDGTLFTSLHNWGWCCTDGQALSDLDGRWSMVLQFSDVDNDDSTPAIYGLEDWYAYSAEGAAIRLQLEEGRRVRLEAVPCSACAEDSDADGDVDVVDFLALLAAWGTCSK